MLGQSIATITTGGGGADFPGLLANSTRVKRFRNPDGSIRLRWLPNGVPDYIGPAKDSTSIWPEVFPLTLPNPWIAIYGDGSGSSTQTYDVSMVAHWEIIGGSSMIMGIPATPSPYDPLSLAAILNIIESLPFADYLPADEIFGYRGGTQGLSVGPSKADRAEDSFVRQARRVADQASVAARDHVSNALLRGIARVALAYNGGTQRLLTNGPLREDYLRIEN